MEESEIEKYANLASETARTAGLRLAGISGRRINSDAGNDVKLQEDVESEEFIRNILAPTGIPVVGEEKGGDSSLMESDSLYWIVDPIDGSYNFLRGMRGVCVSIALMRGMKPIVGAIYDFTCDELFCGGSGLPLTLNGRPIKPSWASEIRQAVLMTGFPSATDYSDSNLGKFVLAVQNFKKVRMVGSACVAISWVACGRADAYYEDRLYLWDVAAGLSLIESAGGVYEIHRIKLEGKPFCIGIRAAAKREFIIA